MTIRGKFNLAMVLMFVMMLGTALLIQYLVITVSRTSLSQARMRELSIFTDDVRAEIFYQTAVRRGFGPMREVEGRWPDDVLEDVDIRIHHASTDRERASWQKVRGAITTLAGGELSPAKETALVRQADDQLRRQRRDYDDRTAGALASTAQAVSFTQLLAFIATLLSTGVFAIVVLMIRDWFVKPIQALGEATEQIGAGDLDHRVSIPGRDELASLAKQINAMAARLRQHQEQLLDAREMAAVGNLCAQVAHGLRNPLAGMRARAQLAQRRLRDRPETQRVFTELITEVDSIDERISRLFEFCQPGHLKETQITFAELLASARSECASVLAERRIDLHVSDLTDNHTWLLDRENLAEAMSELLTNAVCHSDDGSVIDITADISGAQVADSDGLHIVIQDHGHGMHPNAVRRAFEILFTTRPDGTGMGLPLVKRTVNQLGGEITLASTPNEGTRIDIHLPDRGDSNGSTGRDSAPNGRLQEPPQPRGSLAPSPS